MSGFGGGGFGSQPPTMPTFGSPPANNQAPPFGAATPQQQQQQGFGAPSFGAAPPAFGNPQQPPASNQAITFGTSSSLANPAAPTNSFAPAPAFGTTPFGSPPSATPFGQQATSSTSNFAPTGLSAAAPPFQPQPAAPFGSVAPAVPNPFGGGSTAATSAPIQFGVSSSIKAPEKMVTDAPGLPGFASAVTVKTSNTTGDAPFGSFGGGTSNFGDDDMMDGGDAATDATPFGGTASSTTTTPFGTSTTTTPFGTSSSTTTFGKADTTTSFDAAAADTSSSTTTPFGTTAAAPAVWSRTNDNDDNEIRATSSMSPTPKNDADKERLAKLTAEIEAKKKRLERRKKAAAAASASGMTTPEPTDVATPRSPPPTIHLPSELQNRRIKEEEEEEEDLPLHVDSAVSLVGTCPYMCPDDELVRRQREGDIQLLETPLPGKLHPQDWDLRNTAVKRFRRSAADYKLNVPEWVRPPDVLERVCAYLEEWVMERDRQGPDPRFPQMPSPPPLDVYLFCWDRTRMIRKDFILQNYVGTGGKCNAGAVRCHERIARWHAMCEHQLSHIPEYCQQQSGQNIAELMQTLKTLNQYYDDSLGRAIVEEPDEEGKETSNLQDMTHGCSSDIVMGNAPFDFDDTPLKNDATNVSKRLIGPHNAKMASHGTAEPEMRALYIFLLLMNANGNMEVLNHATHLIRTRPGLYHSEPIQLAMRISMTIREKDYAQFFSILRSSSTPYLFACIMFKFVEPMRKIAFRIMSRTYGNRRGEEIAYDYYPLKRLQRLLCFEDEDEARAACKHYNITVKGKTSSSSGSVIECVFWKHSAFKEPIHKEKGVVLRLQPKKMIRTIESKRNGATRLAVCRGEVSGSSVAAAAQQAAMEAAANKVAGDNRQAPFASSLVASATAGATAPPVELSAEEVEARRKKEAEDKKVEEQRLQQMKEEAAKRKMEEKRRLRELKKKEEEEKRKQQEIARQKEEEAKRQALLREKQAEEELRKKKAEEERLRKIEMERARLAAEAAAKAEEQRRLEEERRKAAEREAAARRAEAERQERIRQEELRRQREEEERKERARREAEEKKRREEEQRRLEQLRLQRLREEEERKRREEEERRIAAAWQAKIDHARKLLVWRRLHRRVEGRLREERTRRSLSRIDPTFGKEPLLTVVDLSGQNVEDGADFGPDDNYMDMTPGMQILDRLISESGPPLNLPAMLRNAFNSSLTSVAVRGPSGVVLAKLGVVLPALTGSTAYSVHQLLHEWLSGRFQYSNVLTDVLVSRGKPYKVRTVVTSANDSTALADCDVVLFVVPPFFGDESLGQHSRVFFPRTLNKVPSALLCLDNGSNGAYSECVNELLTSCPDMPVFQVHEQVTADDYRMALEECCTVLLQNYANATLEGHTRTGLSRIPISKLGSMCIRCVLWRGDIRPGPSEQNSVLDRSRAALLAMVEELNTLAGDLGTNSWRNWPSAEFAVGNDGMIKNYFGDGTHLPLCWRDYLDRAEVEPAVMKLYRQLDGTFRDVIGRLTCDAPPHVRQECEEMMMKRQFRRCLEFALWRESGDCQSEEEPVVYIPKESMSVIVEGCADRLGLHDDTELSFELIRVYDDEGKENDDERNVDEKATESSFASIEEPGLRNESESQSEYAPETSMAMEEDLRTPDSGMATPIGVMSPLTVPPSSENLLKRGKRLLDSIGDDDEASQTAKRRNLSKNEKESKRFTEKLEALVQGDTIDMRVGKESYLSELLRGAPKIKLPPSFR